MELSREEFEMLLSAEEGERLECKAAKDNFSDSSLLKYGCALANEGGGKLLLGVTDRIPRQVTGTNAYPNLNKIKQKVMSALRIRVDIDEFSYLGKRVLCLHFPARPLGIPLIYDGTYWMRRGEELVPMTQDMLKRIFQEAVTDFSAQICKGAGIADLADQAIEHFRERWIAKSGNDKLKSLSSDQLLFDSELVVNHEITYAALILLGTKKALSKYLSQAEVIFEYRSTEKAGPAGQREEFREGFFTYYDRLWESINLRNEMQHFQEGLFMRPIPTFSEGSIREAILNAVSHRDYQHPGSIFVRQHTSVIEIESPGGFPSGITADNLLFRQLPRNRRIAETLGKCGFVERSGQGVDRMYEEAIEQGKSLPDFSRSEADLVVLRLDGRVQDINFLKYLSKASQQRSHPFSTRELLVLDSIQKGKRPDPVFNTEIVRLKEEGLIESAGRGKYLLHRKYYILAGKKGVYTRKKGLDRETNKQLLLKHIRDNKATGSKLSELTQVLPSLTMGQVQRLLKDLKKEGKIEVVGKTSAALWYPIS